MLVVFRADASHEIGSGHVVRCLTLASALREEGAQCRFVSREHGGNLLDLIRQQGFDVICLPVASASTEGSSGEAETAHAAWLGERWQNDAAATASAIGETRADWLIVDHYALDARWEGALHSHCDRLMVIDDLADRPHDCDLLLDQNLVADAENRYEDKVPASCRLLLGPEFALLQPQYGELHASTAARSGPPRRVLVYFGAAHTGDLTRLAVEAFLSLERADIALDVVLNPDDPDAELIRDQIRGHENIVLHGGLPSLAPLMAKADLAVGAGGTTTWERCCLGLAALVVTIAENQKPAAAELQRQGLIRWLGDKAGMDLATLRQGLETVLRDGVADAWSARCRQLVDGQGANRVIRELMARTAPGHREMRL